MFDDIISGIEDTVSSAIKPVGSVFKEAYSDISSFGSAMSAGLSGAESTVSKLFGSVDIFDAGSSIFEAAEKALPTVAGIAESTVLGPAVLLPELAPAIGAQFQRVAEDLNPQPLPPGPAEYLGGISKIFEGFERQAEDLNPQPLPPGPPVEQIFSQASRAAEELNPQPLPPHPEALFSEQRNELSMPFMAADQLSDANELNMIQIQQQISQRQNAMQISSQLNNRLNSSMGKILKNIG
ncbi:MAG: hypothetical protein K2X27_07340 [Candidatus Obscuribacterales bacterium]|nr:hypothetical protein [Candidatus Obscuribacterales bacterium]